MSFFGRTQEPSQIAPLGELLQRLDDLHREQLRQRDELAQIEEEVALARRAVKSGGILPPHMADLHQRYEQALPKAQKALKATNEAIEKTHRDIEAAEAAARHRPMSESDRKMYDCAAAYIAAVAETMKAAEAFAAKARLAVTRGEALSAAIGTDHAKRMFWLGHWRMRFTAGVVRLFERDPEATGGWGQHGALIELGDAKRNGSLARNGFLETERQVARDLLPANIGEIL